MFDNTSHYMERPPETSPEPDEPNKRAEFSGEIVTPENFTDFAVGQFTAALNRSLEYFEVAIGRRTAAESSIPDQFKELFDVPGADEVLAGWVSFFAPARLQYVELMSWIDAGGKLPPSEASAAFGSADLLDETVEMLLDELEDNRQEELGLAW